MLSEKIESRFYPSGSKISFLNTTADYNSSVNQYGLYYIIKGNININIKNNKFN